MAFQNLVGQKFNLWTVIDGPTRRTSDGDRYWQCKCECGTQREVRGSSLRRGKSISCGCYRKKKLSERTDLIGQVFDKLTVIEKSPNSTYGNIMWKCKCQCGNEIERSTSYLHRSDFKHSCGCAMVESLKKDITNQRFGKLIAIKELNERHPSNNKILWLCQCDCGNIVKLPLSSLTSGNTSSCGCINYSIGEKNIETLLLFNNISFKSQYTNKELNLKKYDFAILNNDNQPIRFIEFDGRQHYDNISGLWNSPESLEDIQERDKIKNEYALSNNIPLVRIPYWERDKITLEMLMGDKYLVRNPGHPTV